MHQDVTAVSRPHDVILIISLTSNCWSNQGQVMRTLLLNGLFEKGEMNIESKPYLKRQTLTKVGTWQHCWQSFFLEENQKIWFPRCPHFSSCYYLKGIVHQVTNCLQFRLSATQVLPLFPSMTLTSPMDWNDQLTIFTAFCAIPHYPLSLSKLLVTWVI